MLKTTKTKGNTSAKFNNTPVSESGTRTLASRKTRRAATYGPLSLQGFVGFCSSDEVGAVFK